MARLFLIVDGYNLMHAVGLGRSSYGPGGLEQHRNRLIKQLAAALDHSVARDTIVVFDANQAANRESSQEFATPFSVLFSRDGRDADEEIELLLSTHSSPKQVLVISSDHRLHKAAGRRRAKCMDSEEFWPLLESPDAPWSSNSSKSAGRIRPERAKPKVTANSDSDKPVPAKPGPEQPGSTSEIDADYAQDFLKIDVSEINRSVRKERPWK